jgi:hypothetical protein
MLRCSSCSFVEFFRCDKQTIRAHYVEDDVDEDELWRRYDAPLRQQQTSAPQSKRRGRPYKRKLVPRVVEGV